MHVLLVAPRPLRLARLLKEKGMRREDAGLLLQELDGSRARLVQEHFHRDIEDPLLYDAVLNMEHLPLDEAADVVIGLVRQRMARALHEPLSAAAA